MSGRLSAKRRNPHFIAAPRGPDLLAVEKTTSTDPRRAGSSLVAAVASFAVDSPAGTETCAVTGLASIISPNGAATSPTPSGEPQAASADVATTPNRPKNRSAVRRDTREAELMIRCAPIICLRLAMLPSPPTHKRANSQWVLARHTRTDAQHPTPGTPPAPQPATARPPSPPDRLPCAPATSPARC